MSGALLSSIGLSQKELTLVRGKNTARKLKGLSVEKLLELHHKMSFNKGFQAIICQELKHKMPSIEGTQLPSMMLNLPFGTPKLKSLFIEEYKRRLQKCTAQEIFNISSMLSPFLHLEKFQQLKCEYFAQSLSSTSTDDLINLWLYLKREYFKVSENKQRGMDDVKRKLYGRNFLCHEEHPEGWLIGRALASTERNIKLDTLTVKQLFQFVGKFTTKVITYNVGDVEFETRIMKAFIPYVNELTEEEAKFLMDNSRTVWHDDLRHAILRRFI